ncbi:YxeA family protein [Lentilactobacillus buchneri]|uniref:YxeA family protein n=1 Tax=Lentilactobacillus buchneri TaxID=1581 RepID=UPI0021A78D5E|nr:YxeA family protein [Lentilactobacillus buchneri]MCT2881455.1 YxeA family protein [Lentilactobacillus buchneri]
MKKRTIIILAVLVVLGAIGGIWYHHNYARIFYYGQVGKLERTENSPGNNPDVHYYLIKAYNDKGQGKTLEVGSVDGKYFVKGHYIKIGYSRSKNVVDYEEIPYSQVPKAAKEKLNHSN